MARSSTGSGERTPALSARGEARRQEREARLARALRDNLRRRKSDLAGRWSPDSVPPADEPETDG